MGEISRLGEGLDRTGSIDESAVLRTLECLERFVQEAEYSGASHIRVAATSAMRSAANGHEVAGRLSERIGYPVEILSGEEEARLVFLAVSSASNAPAGRTVVIDIGGGSTEIIVGDGDEGRELISLPLGCVHLTERYITGDPPIDGELDAVRDYVRGIYTDCLGRFGATSVDRAVGVGGTVTAFGAVDMGLTKYDPSRIENHYISAERIALIEKELCAIPLDRRREMPGVSRGRADIIPAGSVILAEFVSSFPVGGLHVSTRGLRYGLVLSEARRTIPKFA
jgi:exopolyphosphatase/guanosine-5'-triphosphate,3'-diphosphate pyrophosphatase